MAENTKIQWTGDSWNPLRFRNTDTGGTGHFCEKVSPGCSHCYSERMQPRFKNKIRFNATDKDKGLTFLDEKVLCQPTSKKKGRMIFVCSMTDIFGEWVQDWQLDRIFAVMAETPWHTYQVLTKRTERMQEYLSHRDPLPNVWLGVSAEDQQRADERIPHLLATPAAVRFVSYEPAIGPIDFSKHLGYWRKPSCDQHSRFSLACIDCARQRVERINVIDWVICGWESGPRRRPSENAWFDSTLQQCTDAGVACFIKQVEVDGKVTGEIERFPERLRVREFPRC